MKDIYEDDDLDIEIDALEEIDEKVEKVEKATGRRPGKQVQVLDSMVPGHDLGAYVTAVNRVAILSADEERELATPHAKY